MATEQEVRAWLADHYHGEPMTRSILVDLIWQFDNRERLDEGAPGLAPVSPINPARCCTDCGMTMTAWATDETGCHWPDGQVGCFSGFDAHLCPRCHQKRPRLDDCPACAGSGSVVP